MAARFTMAAVWLMSLAACAEEAVILAPLQASTLTSEESAGNGSLAAGTLGNATKDAAESRPGAGGNGAVPAPDWLGTRVLPTVPGGAVVTPQTTPGELQNRQLITVDKLDPPTGDRFESSLGPVPADVLARSTWTEECPVTAEELNYLTMSFWGFDGNAHTGEMIVNADVAADVLSVFARLHEHRFPIEEMSVVDLAALDAEPTGDGNNTTSFVCRVVTGGSAFSQHAHGLAIDINPFHNPYQSQDLVLPELAVDYLDRGTARAGMIEAGDPVVSAFAGIGWSWGGNWTSLKDYQHFSLNNR